MTFLQLQTECYDRLGAPTPDSATTALVKRMVNSAINEFCTFKNWDWMETSASLSISNATRGYTLASTVGKVVGIHDSNGAPLTEVSRDTYYDMYRGDATTGSPTHYCVDGADDTNTYVTIQVWPVPTGSATLTVRNRRRLTDLSSDGDIPKIPPQYHWVLVDLAVARIREFENDQAWVPLMQQAKAAMGQVAALEFGQRVSNEI